MCMIKCIDHDVIHAELLNASLKDNICVVNSCAYALMTLLRLGSRQKVSRQSTLTVNQPIPSKAEAMQG